ncbi:hypothetical protein Bhyg_17676, partial [Pseudolycoriella hygida]
IRRIRGEFPISLHQNTKEMKKLLVLTLLLVAQNLCEASCKKKCGKLHCPLIPSSCPSGETLTTPIKSNGCPGCPQCTKCILLFCPAAVNCTYGTVTTKQSNGCPGCPTCRKCTPLPCPLLPADCPAGETLTHTTDSDGCPGCSQCCGKLNCPMIPVECPEGEILTSTVLSNGCPGCQQCSFVSS